MKRVLSILFIFVLAVGGGVFSVSSCRCSAPSEGGEGGGDGGRAASSDHQAKNYATEIIFISPRPGELVSGQIEVEVEVRDLDGIREVEFLVNGKSMEKVDSPKRDLGDGKFRYSAEIAVYLLPQGVLSFTAVVYDRRGERAEKTIQVRTRERWAVSFGVGSVRQLEVRSDGHVYVSIYRTEEDLMRDPSATRYFFVGSSISTVNKIGEASWQFVREREELSLFALDSSGNLYAGSYHSRRGGELFSVGPGRIDWPSTVKVSPRWKVGVGDYRVAGKPALGIGRVWFHLKTPLRPNSPVRSKVLALSSEKGTEEWSYPPGGVRDMEIASDLYVWRERDLVFLVRRGGSSSLLSLNWEGRERWKFSLGKGRLLGETWSERRGLLLAVTEGEGEKFKLTAISVKEQKVRWEKVFSGEFSRLITTDKRAILLQRIKFKYYRLVSISLDSGRIEWEEELDSRRVLGLRRGRGDICFTFGVVLDKFGEAVEMELARYGAGGNLTWRYGNKSLYPLDFVFGGVGDVGGWVLVRGLEDSSLTLGTKIVALDVRGRRIYTFSEESRRFEGLLYYRGSLYFSSRDERGQIKVHSIISE